SSAAASSPAGTSTGAPAGACACAARAAEQARESSRTRSGRDGFKQVPRGGARTAPSVSQDERGPQIPPASGRVQDDPVAAVLGAYREALFEQAYETLGIGPAEAAADAHLTHPRIADHDLARVVAVEFAGGVGQGGVAEHQQAAAPVHLTSVLVQLTRTLQP